MFTSGRYVIIDDELDELRPLVEALHQIGAPCIGIHYNPPKKLNPQHFAGVRVLFVDLHLVKGPVGSPHQRYGLISTFLTECINPLGGPYVIVLWTSHEEERTAFAKYIEKSLPAHQKPLSILSLDKNAYLVDGKFANAEQLRSDVEQRIALNPQLRALLSWETDVLTAAGATLAALGELIPEDKRTAEHYAKELDGVLSRLGNAAVGVTNASRDRRAAVNAALAPILLDRILNQKSSGATASLWESAVTRLKDLPAMNDRQAGRMNRMLHLSVPPGEEVRPTDWGAVVELPQAEMSDAAMQARFGLDAARIREEVFRLEPANHHLGKFVLVRTGAACDHAQGKVGPIPYVLSLMLPSSIKRKGKASLAELDSPVFELSADKDPVIVVFNARFQVSLVEETVKGWATLFRIREQLLVQILGHAAGHVTRPGIVKLPQ